MLFDEGEGGARAMYDAIKRAEYTLEPDVFGAVSADAVSLIRELLVVDCDKRCARARAPWPRARRAPASVPGAVDEKTGHGASNARSRARVRGLAQRISAKAALEHPWFVKHRPNLLAARPLSQTKERMGHWRARHPSIGRSHAAGAQLCCRSGGAGSHVGGAEEGEARAADRHDGGCRRR